MGNFPVTYTTRTISGRGPNVFGQIRADTGGLMVARALGQLGGAIGEWATVENRIDAAAQLSMAERQAEQMMDGVFLRYVEETDHTTYMPTFQRAYSDIEAAEIKNPLAKRMYQNWLNRIKPGWERTVQAAIRARKVDNYKASYFEERAKAVQTGIFGKLV